VLSYCKKRTLEIIRSLFEDYLRQKKDGSGRRKKSVVGRKRRFRQKTGSKPD